MLGSICRYHETDEEMLIDDSDDENEDEDIEDDEKKDGEEGKKKRAKKQLDWISLTGICERTFTSFLSKSDPEIKCAALRALTGVFIAHPRELLRLDQSGVITDVMASEAHPSVQIESLRCWRDILLVSISNLSEHIAANVVLTLLFLFVS